MIIGLSIILFILTKTINASSQYCNNQTSCYSTSSASSCQWYCVNGCIELSRDENNNLQCINQTASSPTYYINFGMQIYSSILDQGLVNYSTLIKFLNSSDFDLIQTDYRNNVYGNGVSCPYGCFERNRECIPLNTNYICYPEKQIQCPDQNKCVYNMITNSCTTNQQYVVCGTNKKHKKCPYACQYDYNNDICYSQSPDVICDLGYITVCPTYCGVNYDDVCVPNTYPESICHHIPVPQCSDGCYYNFTNKQCMSKLGDNFCQAYVSIKCGYGYNFDFNSNKINNCNYNMKNNINDICLDDNKTLKFPLNLIEKYKNIKCKYSNVYCSNNQCNVGGCPYYVRQCYM